jgi:hypothetical protein
MGIKWAPLSSLSSPYCIVTWAKASLHGSRKFPFSSSRWPFFPSRAYVSAAAARWAFIIKASANDCYCPIAMLLCLITLPVAMRSCIGFGDSRLQHSVRPYPSLWPFTLFTQPLLSMSYPWFWQRSVGLPVKQRRYSVPRGFRASLSTSVLSPLLSVWLSVLQCLSLFCDAVPVFTY